MDAPDWRQDGNHSNDELESRTASSGRTDKEKCWQTTSDALNLQMFLSCFERREDHLEETSEWIVIPLTHCFFHSIKQQDQLKAALTKGKMLSSEAAFCLWTTADKQTEEQHAAQMKEWMNEIGWKTASGQIHNEQHKGCIEGRRTHLTATNRQIVNRLPD